MEQEMLMVNLCSVLRASTGPLQPPVNSLPNYMISIRYIFFFVIFHVVREQDQNL